jgi:hypothetical protein
VQNYGEGQTLDSYVPVLLARGLKFLPPKLPPAGAQLPAGAFDVQEDQFSLFRKGDLTTLVDDPKASNGRAARAGGGTTDWSIQFRIPGDAPFAGQGPWDCYLFVRVDAKAKSGGAFAFGLHEPGGREYVARDAADLEFASDGQFHPYAITVNELTPAMYFWISPPGDARRVEAIYVDRIILRKRGLASVERR